MKKIIVALACVVQITCFAMNEKDKTIRLRDMPRRLVESQEKQAEALQVIAHANRYMACLEYNKRVRSAEMVPCEQIARDYLGFKIESDK